MKEGCVEGWVYGEAAAEEEAARMDASSSRSRSWREEEEETRGCADARARGCADAPGCASAAPGVYLRVC